MDKEFLIRVRADIQRAIGDLQKVENSLGDTGDAGEKAAKGVNKSSRALNRFLTVAAAYAALRVGNRVLRDADAYLVLDDRVRAATRATGDYVKVSRQLFDISRETGTELAATVGTFQRLAGIGAELGVTNTEMLTLTRLVSQLAVIGGTTPQQLSDGLLQFSQGLAEGTFRAQEFNSILDQMPELVNRLARGLGVGQGELRKMVRTGRLLSSDVLNALLAQAEEIGDEFGEMDRRVSRAGTSFSNSLDRYLGKMGEVTGATDLYAQSLDHISGRMDNWVERQGKSVEALAAQKKHIEELIEVARRSGDFSFLGGDFELRRLQAELKEVELLLNRTGVIDRGQGPDTPDTPQRVDDAATEAAQKLTEKLREQAATFGETELAVLRYRLEQGSLAEASPEVKAQVLGLIEVLEKTGAAYDANAEATRKYEERQAAAAEVTVSVRTPTEALRAELERLTNMLQSGDISWETYARAALQAVDAMQAVEEKAEKAGTKLSQFAISAARRIESALSDTLFQSFKGEIDDLGQLWADLLLRMAADAAAAKILQNIFPGTFSVGGPVQRRAGGGYISGPGTATSDSIPAWLSDGEFVIRASAVDHYGANFFAALNRMSMPRFAGGGLVRNAARGYAEGGPASGGGMRVSIDNRGTPKRVQNAQVDFDIHGVVVRVVQEDLQTAGPLSRMLTR